MTDIELLEEVKVGLNIYSNIPEFNRTISNYIREVKQFMLDGGVNSSFFDTEKCIGIVTIGVGDLYRNGSLSDYFYKRLYQLKYGD